MVVSSGWEEERKGSYCLMCIEFQFCKTKRLLDVVGGSGYTTK